MVFQIENFSDFTDFFFVEILFVLLLAQLAKDAHAERIGLISDAFDIEPHLLAIAFQFDLHLPDIILQLRNLNLKLLSLPHLRSDLILILFPQRFLIILQESNMGTKGINLIVIDADHFSDIDVMLDRHFYF